MKIILGSASPRRRDILNTLGLEFEVVVSNADENCDIKEPGNFVSELSLRKARATEKLLKDEGKFTDDMLIIGCDSVVVLKDEILGKPNDRNHARKILNGLSGNSHFVISGLTLLWKGKAYTDFEKTEVVFDTISEKEIEDYLDFGEYTDKAGAYAVQGRAARFIKGIFGCYYNVVGLPVHLMRKMAEQNGITLFN